MKVATARTAARGLLNAAVSRIDQPILTESWLRIGAKEFGMMWRSMIIRSEAPET